MVFRPTREPRGSDRWLGLKITLLVLGGAIGLAGMATERDVWVGVGAFVLLLGVFVRLLPDSRE